MAERAINFICCDLVCEQCIGPCARVAAPCGCVVCKDCAPAESTCCPVCKKHVSAFCEPDALHSIMRRLCIACRTVAHPHDVACPNAGVVCPAAPLCRGVGPEHVKECDTGTVAERLLRTGQWTRKRPAEEAADGAAGDDEPPPKRQTLARPAPPYVGQGVMAMNPERPFPAQVVAVKDEKVAVLRLKDVPRPQGGDQGHRETVQPVVMADQLYTFTVRGDEIVGVVKGRVYRLHFGLLPFFRITLPDIFDTVSS